MIKRLIEWLKVSNRWKHLLLGLVIGVLSSTAYCAFLAGACTAGGMELKDRQHGGKFDWRDFGMTAAGVVTGYLLHLLIWKM